ncbi:MAG TPA: hypothetical protein VFT22_07250 [Kofleriaceae bacterium]|nr:hypothetical protein [Kofleriaceae bacterium]
MTYSVGEIRSATSHETSMHDAVQCISEVWSTALDEACAHVLALGFRDIMRVVTQPGHHEELWIDCPSETVRIGGHLRGRPVYRQRLVFSETNATVSGDWLL